MTFSSDDNRPMPQQPSGSGLTWERCYECGCLSWCLREDDNYGYTCCAEGCDKAPATVQARCEECGHQGECLNLGDDGTYCVSFAACDRRLRRQRWNPRSWLGWCRMRWRELVTYPQEARRPPLPPSEPGAPPWAREGGEDR